MRAEAILRRVDSAAPLQGAELGVWDGRLSWRLLTACPQLTLYMVDRWASVPDNHPYRSSGAAMADFDQHAYDAAKLAAIAATQFADDRAVFLQAETVEAADRIEDGSLDFVFIDADHSYQACSADLEAWYPKVRVGGIVGGHDWEAHNQLSGVAEAVEGFVLRNGIAAPLALDENNTWFFVKPERHTMTPTKMKIVTVLFPTGGVGKIWHTLYGAFRESVRRLAADCELMTIRKPREELAVMAPKHCLDNTIKLHAWRDAVHACNQDMLLVDADAVIFRSPAEVFEDDADFDVAYTVRDSKYRINAGVVFVRPNERSRAFFDAWVTFNDAILRDCALRAGGLERHGGLNQAALAMALKDTRSGARFAELPCSIWNSVQDVWDEFDPKTCGILHVKGDLRKAVNGDLHDPKKLARVMPMLRAWKEYSV